VKERRAAHIAFAFVRGDGNADVQILTIFRITLGKNELWYGDDMTERCEAPEKQHS
jgi:hypothetical protein